MKTTRSRATSPSPWLRSVDLWTRFLQEQTAMMWSAGTVVGRRTTRMAAHGAAPNAHERRELRTMVAEKQSAWIEGSMAAWQEWMRIGQSGWIDAPLRIADAALKPTRARVAANHRRLTAR